MSTLAEAAPVYVIVSVFSMVRGPNHTDWGRGTVAVPSPRVPLAAVVKIRISGIRSHGDDRAWLGAEPATPAQNQLGFNVDSIYHYNRDRTDQYWTVDGVYGMQFTNIPFGTNNTETTAEHLIIRGPAAQTTPFITVAQNGITCISVNSKAEMFIDGSSVGAGAGGTAMLQVRGRVGTSLSVLFEDRNAQPIFSIAGDGSYTLNNGLLLQRNSISVQTSGGVETFAVVNSSGIIRTNQTAAATTPGSVTHKMPIYDTSGTLVGYIPIYNAIT